MTELATAYVREVRYAIEGGDAPTVAAATAAQRLPEPFGSSAAVITERGLGKTKDGPGFDQEFAEAVYPFFELLHDHWWRIEAEGTERVPAHGRAMLVANHSGSLFPFDAAMITTAMIKRHSRPRWPRFMVLDWAFTLPALSSFFRRVGGVPASPAHAARILADDDLLMTFPEGTRGTGKPYSERYRLQRFGSGFVDVALRSSAPIVPVAVVGGEETYPMVAESDAIARALGAPYFPITPTFPLLGPLGLIPLPSKWRIEFGAPIDTSELGPAAASDPDLVASLTERVRTEIEEMVLDNLVRRGPAFG